VAEVSADDISLINNNSGPFILLSAKTVLDSPPGGNNNGRFDPGESGGLILALRNIGNQGVDNVTALLRSTDSRFIITDSTTSYGSIPVCSTRTNTADPFRIQVDPSIPKETPVQLLLLINGNGYCDTLRFRLVVGEIVQTDPVPDGPRQPPLYWAYDDIDTSYTQHPEFSWVEINNLGTRLDLSDDQTVVLDLPFTWQFYGEYYSQISICSNGWVAPGYTTSTVYYNYPLPSTTLPGAVCANWDDLYPPIGNGVWYYHDAPNHRFIIEWDSVHYIGSNLWERFEIIIYDQTVPTPTGDNQIVVQYLTANSYSSSTVGIQDPSQSIAIQCLYDGTYNNGSAPIVPGRAIKYVTGTPTAIRESNEPVKLPARFYAFPNPGRGLIHFVTEIGTAGSISIFDRTGRLVTTIQPTSRTWDGRDATGKPVSPGVYFCRLKTVSGPELEAKLIVTR